MNENLLTVAGSARPVMLNVIVDADDEVTLSGLTAPRYFCQFFGRKSELFSRLFEIFILHTRQQ